MHGMLHAYCGDGKGKTTAAFGLALRVLGQGGNVCIAQFLKCGDSGECKSMSAMTGCTLLSHHPVRKFTSQMNAEQLQETKAACEALLQAAFSCAQEQQVSLLVMDEAFGAISAGVLEEALLLQHIRKDFYAFDIVLTGRNPSNAVLACCDYVTEMHKRKHPYDQGIAARQGIEY